MQNVGSSTYVDTQLHKIYAALKTKIKQIQQLHLPLNMTNSNSYCYNSRHDDHKFIGEHNMCFKFYDHFQW